MGKRGGGASPCHLTAERQAARRPAGRAALCSFIGSCQSQHPPASTPAPAPLQAKQDTAALQERSKEMKAAVKEAEDGEAALAAARDEALLPIGNIVHDSVPIDDNEVRALLR